MADKQDIREDQMIMASSVDYLRGLKGKDSVLINPRDLPYPNTGGGYMASSLSNGKWYRIATGGVGSEISSAIINIGNRYNHSTPGSKLIYVCADGYSDNQIVSLLASGGNVNNISKARILYKSSIQEVVMLDIYCSYTNDYHICYSNNIRFTFRSPEEVGESVPEGYSVKEFHI